MMEVQTQPVASSEVSTENAVPQPVTSRRAQKRKRRRSNEANAKKALEEVAATLEGGRGKRPRNRQMSISSKTVANHVMKTRLLGSESDPLNLEGVSGGAMEEEAEEECSTCAPSPVFRDGGQPALPPPHLMLNPRDPLNLEGRTLEQSGPTKTGGNRKRRGGRRQISSCPEEGKEEAGGGEGGGARGGKGGRGRGRRGGRKRKKSQSKKMETSDSAGAAFHPPVFKPQDQRYCYGNFDMYYGYRCGSRRAVDPRISLMRRDWFEGRECLDIGCNTGQITLAVAQHFSPQRIVGVDIDHKLIRIANKNLFREQIPAVAPDGRMFPSSFSSSAASLSLLSKFRVRSAHQTTSQPFPDDVEFTQENYVPESEEDVASTHPQYDVILALSITKWVHLNWGDAGLCRMFRKIFRHLRPGGRLILEPQPFSSYARKKTLTPTTYKNYNAIKLRPNQFHTFLMSQEVGFAQHKFLGVPHHKSEGFRRPLHLYIKSQIDRGVSGKVGEGRGEVKGGDEAEKGGKTEGGEGRGETEGGEEREEKMKTVGGVVERGEMEGGEEGCEGMEVAAVVTGGEGEGERVRENSTSSSSVCVEREPHRDRTSGE